MEKLGYKDKVHDKRERFNDLFLFCMFALKYVFLSTKFSLNILEISVCENFPIFDTHKSQGKNDDYQV